jgi:hypothetical protein
MNIVSSTFFLNSEENDIKGTKIVATLLSYKMLVCSNYPVIPSSPTKCLNLFVVSEANCEPKDARGPYP